MESSGNGGAEKREMASAEVFVPAECLDRGEIFQVMKEIIGFVLHMHQQIPSILQHLENDFDNLKEERRTLEESLAASLELKPSSRRIQTMKVREVKQGIKKLEKLMLAISNLLSSLQLVLDKIDCFHGAILVLGGSLARPHHVYEVSISNRQFLPQGSKENCRSKLAEVLSRKIVRALLSKGVGSSSYPGPMKLFLLVKAPTSLDLPQHFIPKRDFVCRKKITPFQLHIQCKISYRHQHMQELHYASHSPICDNLSNFPSPDLIWFQCRDILKGLAGRNTQAGC